MLTANEKAVLQISNHQKMSVLGIPSGKYYFKEKC